MYFVHDMYLQDIYLPLKEQIIHLKKKLILVFARHLVKKQYLLVRFIIIITTQLLKFILMQTNYRDKNQFLKVVSQTKKLYNNLSS